MNSILLLLVTAQLPFVGIPSRRFTVPSMSRAVIPAEATDAQRRMNLETIRWLEANTQSVMKRHGELSGGPFAGRKSQNNFVQSARTGDDLIAQASYGSSAGQKSKGTDSTKSTNDKTKGTGAAESQRQPGDSDQDRDLEKSSAESSGASKTKSSTGAAAAGDTKSDGSAINNRETATARNGSQTTTSADSVLPDRTDASVTQSTIGAATRASATISAALLASALTPPADTDLEGTQNALQGRPVSLVEALGRGLNQQQRLEIASLYWKLSLAIADYHWAVDEALQLNALPETKGAIDSPLFATARAAAEAQTLEAKATAVTTQQELADALGQPAQSLPLTVEQPLVGPYRTHFDTIFAGRPAPGRTRAIDRGLPLRRDAIDLRTAAVQAAASAVQLCEQAYINGSTSVETLLYAHRELGQQRRAFLRSVREYNAEIVEYASYVAGPSTTAATIMSMLTRPKSNKVSGVNDAGTFATGREPTLADPVQDPNVQPAGAELDASGRERQGTDDFIGATDEPRTKSKATGENQD
jgi:hypothetical protein